MSKLIMKLFCCTMVSLFLVSCSSLKSEHYVGEKEKSIHGELQEESIWRFEDKVFYVRAKGTGDSATITVSSLVWSVTKQKYEVKTAQVVITSLESANKDKDKSLFLNIKDTKDGLYKIFCLVPSTNNKDMVIFTIDSLAIEKHIKEGKVKAIEKKNDFILQLTKKELDNYIKENLNDIFEYGGAGILKSLSGFNKEE